MKKAIITGASSGLGQELGKQLENKGIKIINISRNESIFENIKCNLNKNKDIENAINQIKKNHSDFDLLILNAGIMPKAEIGKIDFDIDELFKINVTSNFKIINALMTEILNKSTDIVIIGSVCSFKTGLSEGSYSGTKFALNALIKNLQIELKEEDVRVIGVHPGGFNSNLRGKGIFKENYMDASDISKIIINTLELPRLIETSEIILNRKKIKK